MKRYIYLCAVLAAVAVLLSSCRNDWTIKDMPPVPEKADGAGYVEGFDATGAAAVIPVEVDAGGSYRIAVRGRATEDGTAGTGQIACGASTAALTFDQAYTWGDCEVTLDLAAGVNYLEISGEGANGLFQIDYLEIR